MAAQAPWGQHPDQNCGYDHEDSEPCVHVTGPAQGPVFFLTYPPRDNQPAAITPRAYPASPAYIAESAHYSRVDLEAIERYAALPVA
jgi:hypothetical protein